MSREPGGGRFVEASSRTSTLDSLGLTNWAVPLVAKVPIGVEVAVIGSNHQAFARAPEILVMSTEMLVPASGTYAMTVCPLDARAVATVDAPEPNPEMTTVCA
jgi:hypothetical protein